MSRRLGVQAVRVVRAWTRCYTWRLPSAVRERRRAEIDSDLWEEAVDTCASADAVRAGRVLARLARGIGADIAWRLEQRRPSLRRRLVALTCIAGVFFMTWWALTLGPGELPVPAGRRIQFRSGPPLLP